MTKTCGNCGIHRAFGHCPYFKTAFPSSTQGCPKWESEIEKCKICGGPTIGGSVCFVDTDQNNHIICAKCASQTGRCPTCAYSITCDFETNPSPLPKVVMQTIRQGNMMAQTQVINPERVALTCHSCSCWNTEENYCMHKEIGHCLEGKWRMLNE